MIDNKGYRKNVGIVLMNNKNQFLIFKRIGADAWQFPQGGIDKNETLFEDPTRFATSEWTPQTGGMTCRMRS